jgi:hypothetical protein
MGCKPRGPKLAGPCVTSALNAVLVPVHAQQSVCQSAKLANGGGGQRLSYDASEMHHMIIAASDARNQLIQICCTLH